MPANIGNPSETGLGLIGLYAFDTVSIGSRWQLTGGVRWDTVDVDYRLTTLATGERTEIDRSDDMLSWRAAALFKPRVEASLYLAFGTSFNPSVDAGTTGAGFSTAPTAVNNPNLEPEETRSYEGGAKWDALGGRLALNAAIFRTEKIERTHAQPGQRTLHPLGRQRVDGIELSASGKIERPVGAHRATHSCTAILPRPRIRPKRGTIWRSRRRTRSTCGPPTVCPWDVTVGGGVQFMDSRLSQCDEYDRRAELLVAECPGLLSP